LPQETILARPLMALVAVLLVAMPLPSHADPYDQFRAFADTTFGAEREPLVYETFGGVLDLPRDPWEFVSESSAVIGFTSNLPARSYVEYGTAGSYGHSTVPTDRHYSIHLHYLTDLEPGVEHTYRVVMIDERGTVVRGEPRSITPEEMPHAIRIPGRLPGPPYTLDEPNAHYLVEDDIHATDTALIIAADGITLDLGGHEVTYNNRAVVPTGTWLEYVDGASYGIRSERLRELRVLNGHIRQGIGNGAGHRSGSTGFNPVLLNEVAHLEVAGLTVEYSGPQLVGVLARYPSGFNTLHHNVFLDRGTVLTNRHGVGSKSMAVIGDVSTFHTHHNLVKRTRQSALDGARIDNNEIYIDSYGTNSYGIPALVDDREAFGNRIFGTGYHVVGMGWGSNNWWHDNFIHLAGQGPDQRFPEYGDQESLNGIRLTQYGGAEVEYSDSVVEDNVIVITGGACNADGECTFARGLQWSSDPHVTNNVIRNNTIKVVMNDEVTVAAALVTQGIIDRCDTSAPVLYEGNRLISNITTLRLGDSYGAGCNHVFIGNTLVREGKREDFRTFRYAYPAPVKDQFMYDTRLEGGAEMNSVSFSNPEQELTVGWSLKVVVRDDGGAAAGADVVFRAVDGTPLAVRSTDSLGVATVRVPAYVQNRRGRTLRTPTQVHVMLGELEASRWVEVDTTTTVEFSLGDSAGQQRPPLRAEAAADGGVRFFWDRPLATDAPLSVTDLTGSVVWQVRLGPGDDSARWSADDDRGAPLPAGTYIARLDRADRNVVHPFTLDR
jgi:hypothetical protein